MENAENKKIASISISGEITLNLHSLNNEGGEGNQIMTRQVTILDKEEKESTQTGISGDMFKHIHAWHMINYCVENAIPLCEGCKVLDPNRIGVDSGFISILKGIDPEQFNENDSNLYRELAEKQSSMSDEKSAEYKDITKRMKDIEKKYIILKITDESDKKAYEEYNEIIATKLKKGEDDYVNKKNKQDEAKKKKKEIEKKYNLDFSDEEKIDKMIESCAIDDVHGILVTSEKNNLPRKSVIEFAWIVGVPDKNNTETYLHTKVVADAGAKGSATGSNEGQNIFHRPANYGAYAFICNIDVYRIGLNDISRRYPITDEERTRRYKAVIQSLLSTVLNPKGAMTSTQKPHITDFKGVVSVSHKLIPAPTISAINPNYKEEISTIAKNLNKIEKDAIEIEQFNGMGQFTDVLTSLYNAEPYKIK
jgi:CRISPR-associated autoregulator DevR family